MANSDTDSTRKRRSPAEIAQAELDKANERVEKAEKRHEKAQAEVSAASREVTRAKAFRDYAAKNPDLPGADLGDVAGQMARNDGLPADVQSMADDMESEPDN